ncbi:MAG: right-handed parallel beta-helix repeat-containing protein, partial [Planctomycetota bacterium]|nr:right-handed parallel beta-helix repeat-containing protein [Planctomycetota bacterium]
MRRRFLTLMPVLLLAAPLFAADVYVSPAGDDANPGTREKPLATLDAARDAARARRPEGVTVWLGDGVYRRETTFELGAADAGTKAAPVVWRAEHPHKAILLGGRELRAEAFKPLSDADAARLPAAVRPMVRACDLAPLGTGNLADPPDKYRGVGGLPELFYNDRPMTVARWPNEGWVTIRKVLDRDGVFVAGEDRMRRWDLARGVWLHGYWCHDWSDETIRINRLDPAKRTITLAARHGYGVGPSSSWNKTPRRYRAVNVLAELDAPGEYYVDRRAGRLYFYPPGPLAGARIVLSLLAEPIVRLRDASHVTVRGLVIEGGRADGAEVRGGTGSRLAGCVIRNLAGSGAVLTGGTDNRVVGCDLYHLGRSGIRLSGGDRKSLTPAGLAAENNHVHHFARLQRTYAAGVHIGGVGNRMRHNLIHDAPHSAVLYGGNEHVIELNEIHHVALETSDVGALYTGRDWTSRGNVVRHNFIHSLTSQGSIGTMGVYLDDCDSGDSILGNVFYRAGRAAFIGGGRDNRVENNLFVECEAAVHLDARGTSRITNGKGGSWDLLAKARAVGYDRPPWSERYPRLARIMKEQWQL